MKEQFSTVNEYIKSLPKDRMVQLKKLRRIIKETVPSAKESIRWNLPYYDLKGMLCVFASQKQYISLYILNAEIKKKNMDLLKGFNVGKSCVRLGKLDDMPESSIKKLLLSAAEHNSSCDNHDC